MTQFYKFILKKEKKRKVFKFKKLVFPSFENFQLLHVLEKITDGPGLFLYIKLHDHSLFSSLILKRHN